MMEQPTDVEMEWLANTNKSAEEMGPWCQPQPQPITGGFYQEDDQSKSKCVLSDMN